MGERLTNKDFDDIFRDSIGDVDTQPSEGFWIKASENSLFNSTQSKKKAVAKWKLIAASLTAAVVILAAYVFYMQGKLDNANKKLTIAEKKNTIPPGVTISQLNNATASTSSIHKEITPPINQAVDVKNRSALVTNNARQNSFSNGSLPPLGTSKNHNNNHNVAINNNASPANTIAYNQSALQKDQGTISSNSIEFLNGSGNSSILANSAEELTINDNIIPVQNTIKTAEDKSVLSKMSVSLFYQPYLSDEPLENQSTDIVTYNNVSGNEEEVKPFIAGIKIGYDVSTHWTITTGCLYYNFTIGVSPTIIYAQKQQNGDVGYSFQTGMGSVTCPYVSSNPSAGDAITVSGNEVANYISIPLQVKYNFITARNWSFYLTAGIMANIVAYRKMDMHWEENNLNAGNAIEGIDNSRKIYGSYYFAPAISYKAFKGISLFMEPSLQGSPVFSSAKNSPPYVGVGAGITYHF